MPESDRMSPCRTTRRGFSLIELAVVLAVIGLIAALVLPAVQQVRSAAQATMCINRLRQLALAGQNYHDVHTCLPPRTFAAVSSAEDSGGINLLFPYLELPDFSGQGTLSLPPHRFPVIQCPADGGVAEVEAPQSYVLNVGIGTNSGPTSRGPYYAISKVVKVRDVTDGTSHTALFSERATVWPGGSPEAAIAQTPRYRWRVDVPPVSPSTCQNPTHPDSVAERTEQTDRSIELCLNGPRTFYSLDEYWLADWRIASSTRVLYAHAYPPNSPACLPAGMPIDQPFLQEYQYSASSAHSGGVHVAFVDGHVRFVGDTVDRSVWRAVGSMDGGETVGDF